MARTTLADLEQVCKVINNLLERKGSDDRVTIDGNAQGKRAMMNGTRDLSPRLPAGELYRWLEAFESGLDMGTRLGVTPPPAAFGGEGMIALVSHMQECPICGRDQSVAADESLRLDREVSVQCKDCGAPLTVGFSEDIAWTVTAHVTDQADAARCKKLGEQVQAARRREWASRAIQNGQGKWARFK